LVQVVALKNGLPDKTLKRDDFQVFDNGQPISIKGGFGTFGRMSESKWTKILECPGCRVYCPSLNGNREGYSGDTPAINSFAIRRRQAIAVTTSAARPAP
jgi:hypothetical protein